MITNQLTGYDGDKSARIDEIKAINEKQGDRLSEKSELGKLKIARDNNLNI